MQESACSLAALRLLNVAAGQACLLLLYLLHRRLHPACDPHKSAAMVRPEPAAGCLCVPCAAAGLRMSPSCTGATASQVCPSSCYSEAHLIGQVFAALIAAGAGQPHAMAAGAGGA